MFIQSWKRQIFTIPNLLSLLRLILIPVYVMIYWNAEKAKDFVLAGAILAFSCFTDALDGFIARRFSMTSTLGKVLDPLADKATQITLAFCLSLRFPALQSVVILLLFKELAQISGALLLLRKGIPLPSALMAGKISTLILFVGFIILVVFPNCSPRWAGAIAFLDCLCLACSFATYFVVFLRKPRLQT